MAIRGLRVEVGGRALFSGIDLTVGPGEVVALMGPSGSGKTTLLHCLAGLRLPVEGEVRVLGHRLESMKAAEVARLRLEHIGLVLQFGELLPELTVAENVALPLLLRGIRDRSAVDDALASVEMADHSQAWPATLSGGETQRVGIARAIVGEPRLILADEPTGSVDQSLGQAIIGLLTGLARDRRVAMIVATHDTAVANRADRVYRVEHQDLVESCA